MPGILAYHATKSEFETFHPLSHFGSELAAREVFDDDTAGATLILASLDVGNPFEVEDCEGAWNLVDWIDDTLARGLVDEDAHSLMRGACEDVNPTESYPFQKATDMLVTVLEQHGFDAISYENRCEDVGSRSWVILRPEQVTIVSVSPLAAPA